MNFFKNNLYYIKPENKNKFYKGFISFENKNTFINILELGKIKIKYKENYFYYNKIKFYLLEFSNKEEFEYNIQNKKNITQTMSLKDISISLNLLDLNNKDKFLEVGVGSGTLTKFAYRKDLKILLMDLSNQNLNYVKINLENIFKDISNIEYILLKKENEKNIIEEIDLEKITGVDSIFFDVPTPIKILKLILNKVKKGCRVVMFLPNLTQIHEIINKNKKLFLKYEIKELISRNLIVSKESLRYEKQEDNRTGFILYCILNNF